MRILAAKYLHPIDVATKEQLEKAGIKTLPDVSLYEIRPIDAQNPVVNEDGTETGRFLGEFNGGSIQIATPVPHEEFHKTRRGSGREN
jgi:hypothetical protein